MSAYGTAAVQKLEPRPYMDIGDESALPPLAASYPEFRYMGSKHRLLPWIHSVLQPLPFETVADPFVGSACVSYLMKAMGKQVLASDFLNFPTVIAEATIANSERRLDAGALERLTSSRPDAPDFISRTFAGVFYTLEDLRFLDELAANIEDLGHPSERALARAGLIRACLKKQPRGVFTVCGDLSRYDDGRRDLRLSLREHFVEQVAVFNNLVFENGKANSSIRADVFDLNPENIDLVYLDPPYVPRSDDNCYIKRYHFLEGLSCYWQGLPIMHNTKVKKIHKRKTPFGYRKSAIAAFERLFGLFRTSIIVLSYSSNGYPDLNVLTSLLHRYKPCIEIYERPHRYHFGTHAAVERAEVREYLVVAQ